MTVQTSTSSRRSEKVRRHYSELINALQADGDPQAAAMVAGLAVEQQVWRHPLQRPTHYVAALEAQPVRDPADFWFTAYLEANYERIRAEVGAVTAPSADGLLPVEEPLLGRGRWEQVTFYETGVRFDDAAARFPVTASVIDGIPEAADAGLGVVTLSWLYPGSHIVPHCGGSNARLRVHLGLQVPEGARMRVGDQTVTWQEGRCIVFDDSFEHEVWHDGDEPRVILLLDVPHPGLNNATRDWLLSRRTGLAERMVDFMRERGIDRVELDEPDVTLIPGAGAASLVRRHLREAGARVVELREDRLHYDQVHRAQDDQSGGL